LGVTGLSIEIQDEDGFEAYLMKTYGTKFGSHLNLYPKIKKIGGKDISPEIDLLHIDHGSKILTGYEFKFLGYKKPGSNYNLIRQGLGQAIMYFQFGIDRSYLVLGLPKKTSELVRAQLHKTISMIAVLQTRLNFDCLGIMHWHEDSANGYHLAYQLQAKGKFPYHTWAPTPVGEAPKTPSHFKINRDCIFDLRFHYSKGFLKKYGLPTPGWRPKGY